MKALRLTLQILLPLAVLAAGAALALLIFASRKQPIVQQPTNLGPLVRVERVAPTSLQLDVHARGAVEPLRTVELAAEVSGRIVATHPSLRPGGTFTPNDVLVELDDTDYRLLVTQQESAVARAELRLLQEKAEGEAAERAWRELEGERPADPLVRREPQIRDAKLALEAAKAMLEKARTDQLRTKVQLPFAGRVQAVAADIGQTVQRGQRLATVFDTSLLEVRLPIPLADAAFVDLPLAGAVAVEHGPAVELTADFAGARRSWRGAIVRIEGEVDRRTRQLTAVARVRGDAAGDVPLLVGMFVEATITGRRFDDVYVVPVAALHAGDRVWVVEPTAASPAAGEQPPEVEARLRDRKVSVLRIERDRALLRAGLEAGELICLSALDAPVDGMAVRLAQDDQTAQGGEK